MVARAHDGAVSILCVTPDGEHPDWLEVPGQCGGVTVRTMVRAGTNVAKVILEATRALSPNLLLLGWRGSPGQRSYLLGSTLDPVTRYASCDVAVVRVGEMSEVRRALVPMSAGPNAPLAMELALSLSPDIEVTALNVARESLGPTGEAAGYAQLRSALEPWEDDERVVAKVVRASDIIDGILDEAAAGYDLVLIGATNESYIDRALFGNVPQTVAASAPVPTVVVRHKGGPMRVLLRRAGQQLSGVQGRLTDVQRAETYREVRLGGRARPEFFALISLAAAIATLGLWMGSPAVIIGAMVIAPLMSAILGIGLGVTQGDARLIWSAAGTTFRGASLAVGIGVLVSLVVPGRGLTAEILSRTQPTLLDLGVAVLSGIAGAYAQCRRDTLSALSGVAIAVALVPPLTTISIGITMQSGPIAGGALLLFLTNLSAIVSASSLVFLYFGFRPDPGQPFRVFGRSMIGVTVLLLVVSGVLSYLTVSSVRSVILRRQIDQTLGEEIGALEGVELLEWDADEGEETALHLRVRVQSSHQVSRSQVVLIQARLIGRLRRPVALSLSVIPITELEPFAP
jgi:uncharacterized hydrophobic protein (TIGR00271 family)